MLLSSFLGWWYGSGWGWLFMEIKSRARAITEIFSLKILLLTLFSPWKQIKTPSNFHNFFQAAIDNTISRLIGAIIRTVMLLTALVCLCLIGLVGLGFLIIWPILPLTIVIFPILSLTGTAV